MAGEVLVKLPGAGRDIVKRGTLSPPLAKEGGHAGDGFVRAQKCVGEERAFAGDVRMFERVVDIGNDGEAGGLDHVGPAGGARFENL